MRDKGGRIVDEWWDMGISDEGRGTRDEGCGMRDEKGRMKDERWGRREEDVRWGWREEGWGRNGEGYGIQPNVLNTLFYCTVDTYFIVSKLT